MATEKKFDAVVESRKWRVATGKKLSSMSSQERQNYLNDGVEQKLNALRAKTSPGKARRKRRQVTSA
jgi:uncharacterized membrane protein required for colicin V production